jgi:hypothetical protein
MTALSFLNDLGIIPNEGTGLENDSNLLQGQKYMEYGRVYEKSVEPHLKNLQMTSIPNVSSFVEGMHGENSVKSISPMSKSEISQNENEFNKTMIEYSLLYKQLTEHGHVEHNNKHNKELNIKLLKRLENLNKKLIYLSEEIVKEVEIAAEREKASKRDNNKHSIEDVHKKIYEKKKNFNEYIDKLKEQQKRLDKNYMETLIGQEESSKFNLVSYMYKFILLIIVLIVILFVFINVQTNSSSSTDTILIVMICLLGVIYLKNNYFL